MFRISEFSRFTRVSVRMLRHYDRLGLLQPAHVDPRTRYRWYSARQLPRLHRIISLRDLGFSLEHIADLLAADLGARKLRRLLELRRSQIANEVEESRRRSVLIESQIAELDRRGRPSPVVVVRSVPAVRVASRRARVDDLEGAVEELFESLEADVARAKIRSAGPPLILYHDPDGRTENADVEVAVPVLAGAGSTARVKLRTLPALERAACTTYVGGYGQWWSVVMGLLKTLEARRLVPAGPLREVFLQFRVRDSSLLRIPGAHAVDHVEDFVTEMQVPVRDAVGAAASLRRARGPAPRVAARAGVTRHRR